MEHIHETWAFLVKSGILRTSMYNVCGSQNDFVERVTRVFILRVLRLGQDRPQRRKTVIAVARMDGECTWANEIAHQKKYIFGVSTYLWNTNTVAQS